MPFAEPMITRVEPTDWHRFRAIRLASLAEAPEAFGSTLAREEAFEEDEWRRRAARPTTFLASRNGTDIGLAGVHQFNGIWNIVGMWIKPDFRGTGIVDALVVACELVVRQAGASTVMLSVMEDNAGGRSAYLRLGFEFTGDREHVRDGRYQLWMTKSV